VLVAMPPSYRRRGRAGFDVPATLCREASGEKIVKSSLREFIRKIPKAELHVHMDTVDTGLLLRLAERNGVDLPFSTAATAAEWYTFRDLEEYLDKWKVITSVLQTEVDYYELTLSLGETMAEQQVLYCEAMFTYAGAHEHRVTLETMLAGLARGRDDVKRQHGVDLFFIADIDRTIAPERSLAFVDDLAPYREEAGIVAVGLDCEEAGYPASAHKKAFDRARELGFHLTAHAGEERAAGPESVWSAIRDLKVERVDHGNMSVQDDELVAYLVEHQIPLTFCPLSNVIINVYRSIEEHPIKELMDRGVLATINTDDYPLFRTSLNENLIAVAETFALTRDEIIGLVRNGFSSSFAPEADKQHYLPQLDAWLGLQEDPD
jgi:adenosine deaminase